MILTELVKALHSYRCLTRGRNFPVRRVSCDSRQDLSLGVFVAVRGASSDGHAFIPQALKQGAQAVVFEQGCVSGASLRQWHRSFASVTFIEVPQARVAAARLAAKFYGHPSRKMRIIGVTGTNGKTTITYLIEAILREAGKRPAVIGTVNYRFPGTVIPAPNTTPGPIALQELLRGMAAAGVDHLIMEVSSHALDQGRVEGIRFAGAIFTNLTQDHLDYHRDKERYFQAKARLFSGLDPQAQAVINSDDPYGRRLISMTRARVTTYGLSSRAALWMELRGSDFSGTRLILHCRRQSMPFSLRLIGRHNVYNALAAAAWASAEGIGLGTIVAALEKFTSVPGRLEKINASRGVNVFVDYAHTEDALANVLSALKQISRRRLIVVFGCGGDRDKGKRPKMGKVATELADYALITNDNPRSEDPGTIIRDITRGIAGSNYRIVRDRREAIRQSLQLARRGDVVLVAGKGHEDYQIIKDRVYHFDDREAVRQCLE